MSIDDIANRELSRLAKVIEEHKSPFTIRLLRSKLALIVIAVLVFLFQVRGLQTNLQINLWMPPSPSNDTNLRAQYL